MKLLYKVFLTVTSFCRPAIQLVILIFNYYFKAVVAFNRTNVRSCQVDRHRVQLLSLNTMAYDCQFKYC